MKTFTRRLCAALTGISMLMTGVCVPQFTAAAADTALLASEVPADSVLLKSMSGILPGDLNKKEITLTADELDGKTYTRIDAVVEYVPNMYNRVPESSYAPLHMEFEVGRNTMEGDRREFTTVPLSMEGDTGTGTVFHSFNRTEEAFGTYDFDILNLELLVYRQNNMETKMLPAESGTYNLKLYGSTEKENYDYPEVTPLTCTEEKVLKEVCGDISELEGDGSAVLSLDYDELNGQNYDAIYADVFFTPDEEAEVPEGKYRYATEADVDISLNRDPDLYQDPTSPYYSPIYPTGTYQLCRSSGKCNDPYTAIEICRCFSENESLEVNLKEFKKAIYCMSQFYGLWCPEDEGERLITGREKKLFDVPNGMYAIRLVGRNFTVNHMPPADDLTLLGEAECQINECRGTASLRLPVEKFLNKYYANLYVTADYSEMPVLGQTAHSDCLYDIPPVYAAFKLTSHREAFRTAADNSTTEYDGTDTESYVPFHLTTHSWFTAVQMGTMDDYFRPHPSLIRETEITGDVWLTCDLYESFGLKRDYMGGTVTLKVYGYDAFDAPPVADMYPILSTSGRFAATDRKETVLTEDQCYPDYYVAVNGKAGDVAYVRVMLYRREKPDSEEMVKLYETELKNVLINQFGMQKIDFESLGIQPQAGDKIAVGAVLRCSDGDVPNSGYVSATLYGVDSGEKLPQLRDLTLLGEIETDLSGEAEKLKIDFDKMRETGYTNIYAVAEVDGDADLLCLDMLETENMVVSANTPGGPEVIVPNLTQAVASEKLRNGSAVIDLGRDKHYYDGYVEITPTVYKGETEVKSGTVKLSVYGYNRFGMPLYSEMNKLAFDCSPVAAASDELTADGSFDRLWFETLYDMESDLNAEFLINVYQGGREEDQKPSKTVTLDAPLVNGFAAVSATTEELGVKQGDVVWVRVNYYEEAGGKKAYLDGGFYAEMNIYGCVQQQKGDVSCDGVIDVSDAVLLARFIAEDTEAMISDQGKRNADVNKSGGPDQEDIMLILRRIARLISEF